MIISHQSIGSSSNSHIKCYDTALYECQDENKIDEVILNKSFQKRSKEYEHHIKNFQLSLNLENLIPIIYKLKLKFID